MAKSKKKATRRASFRKHMRRPKGKPSLAIILGLGTGLLSSPEGFTPPVESLKAGDFKSVMNTEIINFTGWNVVEQRLQLDRAIGLQTTVIGLLIHKVVGGWLGLNKVLGRSKIPFNL